MNLARLQSMPEEMSASLMYNKDMTIKNNFWNWKVILEWDPDLEGRIRFNSFSNRPAFWREGRWVPIDEDGVMSLAMHIAGKWGICPNPDTFAPTIRFVSRKQRVDPLMDYIDGLPPALDVGMGVFSRSRRQGNVRSSANFL